MDDDDYNYYDDVYDCDDGGADDCYYDDDCANDDYGCDYGNDDYEVQVPVMGDAFLNDDYHNDVENGEDILVGEVCEGLVDDEVFDGDLAGDGVFGENLAGDEVFAEDIFGDEVFADDIFGDEVFAEDLDGDVVFGNDLAGDEVFPPDGEELGEGLSDYESNPTASNFNDDVSDELHEEYDPMASYFDEDHEFSPTASDFCFNDGISDSIENDDRQYFEDDDDDFLEDLIVEDIGRMNLEEDYVVENNECFRLYFKGLVSEEEVGEKKVVIAAIGAAICDSSDKLLTEVKKPLEGIDGGEMLTGEVVEIMALIEGLEAALTFPSKRVIFFCQDYMLYQYFTGRLQPRQRKIGTLIGKVADLRRKFTLCHPSLVTGNDMKFAYRLARDIILSQISLQAETTDKGKSIKATCQICFEDTDIHHMFKISNCLHKYCKSCAKQHIEVKFLSGTIAKCPHEGCESEVDINCCEKFLAPKLLESISQRMKELSIPVTEKVYCPNPKCSILMSKGEVLEYSKVVNIKAEESGIRKCKKCHEIFCIKCKVSWHFGMTCDEYNASSKYKQTEDAKLKSLATENLWQQCTKCNHLVELNQGCNHITCRCGHEFCYPCGAEWKEKKATCSCDLWDENNIIYDY